MSAMKIDAEKVRKSMEKAIEDFNNLPDDAEDPRINARFNKFASMGSWWPLVEGMNINIPRTLTVPVSYKESSTLLQLMEGDIQACDIMIKEMLRGKWSWALQERGVFMRSFFTSAKHGVSDSRVVGRVAITERVKDLLYFSELHNIPFEGIALREHLNLYHHFRAFSGLPIAKEVRMLFWEDRPPVVAPYWPENAIKFDSNCHKPDSWQTMLKVINILSGSDRKYLINQGYAVYDKLSELHPNWSIDFAMDVNSRWWFIDAAPAEDSWVPEESSYV